MASEFMDTHAIKPDSPYCHPAWLDDETLIKQCMITRGKASGPGGQHRNKVETAVEIRHKKTDVYGWASERRSQQENKHVAMKRLRMNLALFVRRKLEKDLLWLQLSGDYINAPYETSPLWRSRLRQGKMSVGPKSKDLSAILAEALDVICENNFEVKTAAIILGCSQSQLIKLLKHEPRALAQVNDHRETLGLRKLN